MSISSLLGGPLPFRVDRIIVGLGNPGSEYANTPHNIGFQVLDTLANQWKTQLKTQKKIPGEVGIGLFNGERILLLKPHTYMNLSGNALAPLMRLYELPPENLMVIVDEINLDYGKMRLRPKGSAGGQNGMKSIIQSIKGSKEFPRLRLGIGPQPEGMPLEDFVLRDYSVEQSTQLNDICHRAVACIEMCLREGVQPAQNTYNT